MRVGLIHLVEFIKLEITWVKFMIDLSTTACCLSITPSPRPLPFPFTN